jgi:putative serine/threonine protein kinase
LQATQSERASPDQMLALPFIRVLSYPTVSLSTARARVKEMKRLGVEHLIFDGRTQVGRLHVLGIGTVGVVVKAVVKGSICALKIRRTDANRGTMEREYRLTTLANRVGVGVSAKAFSRNFIVLQLLEGVELDDWFRSVRGKGSASRAREMVHRILNQCRKLDLIGLDHGQLSNLRKHVFVSQDDKPWLLDFESAGLSRKVRNVTAAAQYLLVGGKISPTVRRLIGIRDKSRILSLLHAYKQDSSDYAYAKLLEELGIQTG